MRSLSIVSSCALAAAGLAACGSRDNAEPAAEAQAQAQAPAPVSPYQPVATLADVMRATVELSAERYWDSVRVVVDADGEHEYMPETDLEWIEVWAAAMTLAESGNLIMMPPRRLDDGQWIEFSTDLVNVGVRAAQIASDRDFEGMLAIGEEIYNVCVECHEVYDPTQAAL